MFFIKHVGIWALQKEKIMAKKKSTNLGIIIPALFALLAFVLAIFLPGAINNVREGVTVKSNLLGMMFGSAKVTTTIGENSNIVIYKGGMSIFGLISAICLIGGVGLIIGSILLGNSQFAKLGSILILLAGVLVFLILVAGTDLTQAINDGHTFDIKGVFKELYTEEWKLGAGTYIYGALCVLGGLAGLAKSR